MVGLGLPCIEVLVDVLSVFNFVVGFGYQLAGEAVGGLCLSDEEEIEVFGCHVFGSEENSFSVLPEADALEVVVLGAETGF
jgi:hypothetical protein